MQPQILLSILVPNRQSTPYIFNTIKNILDCKDERFELLVNENSMPEFLDYSIFESDYRFKIFRELNPISMTQNWYNILEKATGKYVIYIGSDDGCIPENLSILISYLAKNSFDAINTRHSFYNHPSPYSKSFVTLGKKIVTMRSYAFTYPKLLSLLFYSYRTWLPLPYALAVVRREIFSCIIEKFIEIPGIAPDDFLSHFVAQKLKTGIFLDLCVFITGTSPRSNGQSLLTHNLQENSKQFISDSRLKLGKLTKDFGLNCLPSIAIEHYLLARSIVSNRKSKVGKLLKLWAVISCLDKSHHKAKLFIISHPIRKIVIPFLDRIVKFTWIIWQFGIHPPTSNIKIANSQLTNISEAARFIHENTKYQEIT